MSDLKSAKDIMQSNAHKEPVDLVVRKVIGRTTLAGNSKYSYCPYCVQKAIRMGQDWKTCKPMWRVTYKSLYKTQKNEGQIIYEKEWQCPVCRDGQNKPLVLTEDDFSAVYSKYWKGGYTPEKQNHITLDVASIRAAGFENYGM